MKKRLSVALSLMLIVCLLTSIFVYAENDPLKPNGPWITDTQEEKLSSLHNYKELVKALNQIENASHGAMELSVIGQSNQGRDIYLAKVGSGEKKVMFITQQHGNEPLGTEAALQILRFLTSGNNAKVHDMLEEVTVCIVPRVNVDGAEVPWRYNVDPSAPRVDYASVGRGFDINRWHWQNWEDSFLYQMDPVKYPTNPVPEAVAVLNAYNELKPEWVVDLHHQGTYLAEDGDMIKTSILWPTDPLANEDAVILSKKMCATIYNQLESFGYGEVSLYNGGAYAGIARNSYGIAGSGSVLIEMRGVGQKSNGYLTRTFMEAMMALIGTTANGSLYNVDPNLAYEIPLTGPYASKDLSSDEDE